MNYIKDQLTELWIKVQHYTYTNIELYKLKLVEKISSLLSSFVSIGILFVFAISAILFVSIAFALWLGELFGELYFGFLMVACIHILIVIIGFFNRRKLIKNPLQNRIVTKLLEE